MLFKLSNLNSNLALTLGYLNPALNNSALVFIIRLMKNSITLCRVAVNNEIIVAREATNYP